MKFKKAFVFSADADTALALCSGAAALADSCTTAVLGERQLADRLADGADKVFWLGERAEGAITESYCGALEELIRSEAAQLVLLGTGKRDRCIAAKLAVRLDAAVFTDASEVSLSEDGLCVKRKIYGGAAEATVRSGSAVTILSVSAGIFPDGGKRQGEVIEKPAQPDDCGITLVSTAAKQEETADLTAAKRIVSVGRGLGGAENLPAVEALAAKLGAELGCTRPIAEEDKLLAKSRYIGVSGATVRPDVYIACGISGQIQHTVGADSSRLIIAINKDAKAPIMQNCDYGIVGDMHKIIPLLTQLL